MTFNVTIEGTPINVELQSSVLEFKDSLLPQTEFQIVQPQLMFTLNKDGTPINVELSQTTLGFKVVQPQIVFDMTVGAIIPGPPISGMILGEIPSGAIDGTNRNYSSASPYVTNQLGVYLNGLRQKRTNDYSETGTQSFQFVSAPLPGDSILIDYIQP